MKSLPAGLFATLAALFLTSLVLSQDRRDREETRPVGGEDSMIVEGFDAALTKAHEIERNAEKILLWFAWWQYPYAEDPMGVRIHGIKTSIERIAKERDRWRIRFEITGICWWPTDWALGTTKPDFNQDPPWLR